MKKKNLLLVIGIVSAGILSYFGGYLTMYQKPVKQPTAPISLEKQYLLYDDSGTENMEYYVARADEQMLHIYKMPENIIYDSVDLRSLQLSEDDQNNLSEGIVFENLTEVLAFLENSMS